MRGIFILVLVLSRKRKIEVFSCFYELLILKISPVTILKDHTTAIWKCIYEATCTAKNQYRKFYINNPRKGIAQPQSQFPQSQAVSDLQYIFLRSICLMPILPQEIWWLILGIYKSLTDTWMWKLGLGNSQNRNTKMGFSLQCVIQRIVS